MEKKKKNFSTVEQTKLSQDVVAPKEKKIINISKNETWHKIFQIMTLFFFIVHRCSALLTKAWAV